MQNPSSDYSSTLKPFVYENDKENKYGQTNEVDFKGMITISVL